uniref:Coiled-coil domain-containing protein 13 n=1 Tax=Strigamia maritima TaxID=126957 RepID=T1JP69_STRMM
MAYDTTRRSGKDNLEITSVPNNFNVFSLPDDYSLKLTDVENENEESNEEDNEAFVDYLIERANIKDEYKKLKKLISDKDLEIKQLQRKCSDSSQRKVNLPSDIAAIKIVELSRKLRDLTSELESEKTKNKQLHRTVQDLENKAKSSNHSIVKSSNDSIVKSTSDSIVKPDTELDSKKESELNLQLKEKLNTKLSEYRNTCQSLKKDLKMAHKVLQQEVGDGVTIQTALSGTGWRGRAQQILSLQNKISELKDQLEKSKGNDQNTSPESVSIELKHKDLIKKLEKDRKDENEAV